MANKTTNIAQLTQTQASKYATVNELFDAASQSMLGGIEYISGLNFHYYGGNMFGAAGNVIAVANGYVTLTNSATNYIEMDQAGTITANTSAFTEGRTKLYTAVTSGGEVTNYTDYRINFNSAAIYKTTVAITSNTPTITSAYYGKTILWSPTGSGSFTLPANGATAGSWFEVVLLTNQTITISSATAGTLITNGSTIANSVEFSTASHKIGASVMFISNGTYWIAINKSDCTMTVNT